MTTPTLPPVFHFDPLVYAKDYILFTTPVGQADLSKAPTVATIEYIKCFDDMLRAHVSPMNVSFDAMGAGLANPVILAFALQDIQHPYDIAALSTFPPVQIVGSMHHETPCVPFSHHAMTHCMYM